jgi:hypothetical protein
LVPQGKKFALGDLLYVADRLGLDDEKMTNELDPFPRLRELQIQAGMRSPRTSDLVEYSYANVHVISRRTIDRYYLEANARLRFERLFRKMQEPELTSLAPNGFLPLLC